MKLSAQALDLKMVGQPIEHSISQTAKKLFLLWTLCWWGGMGVCAILFHVGVLDFLISTKISLYGCDQVFYTLQVSGNKSHQVIHGTQLYLDAQS